VGDLLASTILKYIMGNDDWDIYESLKHENAELRCSNRRLYYLLDEIMNDIQYEHGLDSPVYAKLKQFFEE
jgi:hypothetical protein